MLLALGRHHGWSRADLDSLTATEAAWWCDAMIALHDAAKKETGT